MLQSDLAWYQLISSYPTSCIPVGWMLDDPTPSHKAHPFHNLEQIYLTLRLSAHPRNCHALFALVQFPSSEPSLQHLLGWTRMHGTCCAWASATKLLPHFAQLRLALTSSLVLLDSLWFAMFWISKHGTLEVTWLSCWGCLSTLPAEYSWVAGRVDSILH